LALITDPRQRGRPFLKGVSGNPAGRPLGARNKTRLRLEALLDVTGEELLMKLIERAHDGEMTALRLCLKLIFPAGRKRSIGIALPALENVSACIEAQAIIIEAAASGELALDEAKALSELVDAHRRGLNAAESDACSRTSFACRS